MLIAEVLGELGYTAIEAAEGASALQVLQSDTRIDLLVTDVGLPGGMNGRQLADFGRIARPESESPVHHRLRGKSGYGRGRIGQGNGHRYKAVCDGRPGGTHKGTSTSLGLRLFGLVEATTRTFPGIPTEELKEKRLRT